MTAATPRSGGCACGAVRFTATVTGDHMHACHCSTCRRLNAGPFMGVDASDIAFEGPVASYASSDFATRQFCPRCGTSLAWRSNDGAFIAVNAFAFDAPLGLPLGAEVFIDSKPDGYAFAGEQQRLTGDEVFAMFKGE